MRRYSLLSLLLSACATIVMAQVDTQFWFAAPWMNSHHTGEAEFHMIMSSYDKDAHVLISQPAWANRVLADTVIPAGSYCDLIIGPKSDHKKYAEANLEAPYNQVSQRGLYISSSEPISAYYQITHANGEAYTLKGANALGTEFVVMSQNRYPNYPSYNGYVSHNNSIQIVATEDGTSVTITPSVAIIQNDGSSATTPITLTLNRGETYAVKSASTAAASHLIGTRVTATKPIALTTSDDSVNPGSGQDAVGEQLVPTSIAGTDYTVLPESNSAYESYYVLALYDDTHLTITGAAGASSRTLNAYEHYSELVTSVTNIHADQPIQVFQFTCRNGESGGSILPPMFCTGSRHVTYKRIPNSDYTVLHLVAPATNIDALSINGNELDASLFKPVPGTNGDWAYANINVSAKPAAMPLEVETRKGVFQLGVTDHASTPQGTLTYGFFSDYNTASHISISADGEEVSEVLIRVEGEDILLEANAPAGVTNFRWYYNGELIGEGESVLLPPAVLGEEGTIRVTAESSVCSVEEAVFTTSVIPDPKPVVPCPTAKVSCPASICEGEGVLPVSYRLDSGAVVSVKVVWSDAAHAAGLRDTVFYSPNGKLNIAIPTALYANTYTARLQFIPENEECAAPEYEISVLVRYSTSVFTQRWNDVLAVLNDRYNRGEGQEGYRFTAYQWYKNDEPIPGATGSYYYAGEGATLDFDALYSVLLTREDGTTIRTCEYQPIHTNAPDK